MPSRDPWDDRRLDWVIGALLFFTFAYFYQGGFSNQSARFDLTLALAFEHRAAIDTFAANTIDKVQFGGHWFLEKAPGASYLALPVPLLASRFWTVRDLLADPWRADLLFWTSTAASVSLLSAVAAVAFRRTLQLLNPELASNTSAAITLTAFGATLALPYSTMLFGHQVAASWLVIGAYALFRAALREDARPRWAAAGWLALGAAVLTEYPAILAAIGIAAAAVFASDHRRRRVLRYSPLFAVPLSLVLVHNLVSFGGPLALGYGKLQGTQFATGMNQGLFGIALPSASAFLQLLFGTYRGLFVYCPILVVALASYVFWPPHLRRRVAGPVLGSALSTVLLISGYSFWQGGTCFGPRHILVTVPLLALGAAYVPAAWMRSPLVLVAAVVSAVVALLGTAITPNVAESVLSPLSDAYLPLLRAGDVSISPMSFLTATTDTAIRHIHYRSHPWAAWNVGELVGLRGWWSLAPLAVVWAVASAAIVAFARRGGRDDGPLVDPAPCAKASA